MTLVTHIENINQILAKNNYPKVEEIVELPSAGSARLYFRVFFEYYGHKPVLAAFNPEVNENIAQYSFSMHFLKKGLNVPEIYAKDESYRYFLLQDLGDQTMLDAAASMKTGEKRKLYQKVLKQLLRFQTQGIKGLDLDVAWPVKKFGPDNILWDLNYFKYYFIKTHTIYFDELKLETDFRNLSKLLLAAKPGFFLYRDFQARNIMIHNGEPWFIDFQGGRQGPLVYDVVSLLYQAKANLMEGFRDELSDFYLDELKKQSTNLAEDFKEHYHWFIWFRIMQVMGAYGYRGKLQAKAHFLQSIPYVIKNIKILLEQKPLGDGFAELKSVFMQICDLKEYELITTIREKLQVNINSFSYKKGGYPIDISGNGGGFAFDCRALPNPGRYKNLKDFTGRDKMVIDFLNEKPETKLFVNQAYTMVKQSIDNYLDRGFNNLQINFGCTGGKHRSVYCAEKIAGLIIGKYSERVIVSLRHQQLEKGI
ncbi:MAG: phosphotransferase [Chlorobi bacterium]|nr:phosphotransferase [Chlorobiota bacterium]